MSRPHSKQAAVIVGVGPGLGMTLAHRFARGGFAVALVARSEQKLAAAAQEIEAAGGEALAVAADATDADAADKAFERVRNELGPIRVLIYNAGTFEPGGIAEIRPQDFERCWRSNCLGGFLTGRQALRDMTQAGQGTIIFTGASASLRGSAGFANLAVGKFGLRALAQSMAREFAPKGIHVAHVIIDGQIDTPAIRRRQPQREPQTKLAPEAIAETYWQLHQQHPTAWTLELDLRPAVEKF
jgi:NAD(P)-dependent dehydrogenase (short-subunit alcohol dehydrogenase family)